MIPIHKSILVQKAELIAELTKQELTASDEYLQVIQSEIEKELQGLSIKNQLYVLSIVDNIMMEEQKNN